MPDRRLLVVAFGTRGDVQPLLALSRTLRANFKITFCAHESHRRLASTFDVDFVAVQSDPLRPDFTSETAVADEFEPVILAATGACGVLFNLFALGAWHIAEMLGVPCVAASPCIIPYAPPSTFEEQFRAELPVLLDRLEHGHLGTSIIGWAHVVHWMWPLWSERWGTWRRERLGLSEAPLSACNDDRTVPLPHATPLLVGVSTAVVAPPAYWPPSVHVCGFWMDEMPAPSSAAPGVRDRIYVGFGSTSATMMDAAANFARVAQIAAADVGCSIMLHACGCESVADAWREVIDTQSKNVQIVTAELPLEIIFATCAAAIHHGGAGTCATALRAGTPSLIVPRLFDQFSWAERLEDAGAAVRIDIDVGATELAAAIRRAIRCRPRCEELSAAIRAEDALGVASRHVVDTMAGGRGGAALLRAARAWKADGGGASDGPPPKRQRDDPSDAAEADVSAAEPLQCADGTMIWTVAPVEAAHIWREVCEREVYLPEGSGLRLPERGLVVDVGANIGIFALWAARRQPDVQLLCVEPAPPSFALLQRNLGSLRTSRAAALPIALGAADGRATLTYFPRVPGSSTLHRQAKLAQRSAFAPAHRDALDEARSYTVDVRPLAAVLRERGLRDVALLKVDVEHDELAVLRGVGDEDGAWAAIAQVVVETHTAETRAAVLALLGEHYPTVGARDDDEIAGHAIVYARR